MSSLTYWVWLSTVPGLSAYSANRLLEELGSPEEIYHASPEALQGISGLREKDWIALGDKNLSRADQIIADCRKYGVRICALWDAEYPAPLRAIADPPTVLYVRGTLPDFDRTPALAVVGSRKHSLYGYRVTKSISYQLAQAGVVIVSGMAAGIDAAAHAAALEAGAPTVAVLGCGPDICYPPENKALFDDIPKRGAIVSEYPPGVAPSRIHFPLRNRIISGLSYGVLVTEARERSGALLTATAALEQGREVFAVPGNIDQPTSAGSNSLLRTGARAVTSGADILEDLSPRYPVLGKANPPQPLPPTADRYAAQSPSLPPVDSALLETLSQIGKQQDVDLTKRILRMLKSTDLQVDTLIAAVPDDTAAVTAALTVLELTGKIKQKPGKIFGLA